MGMPTGRRVFSCLLAVRLAQASSQTSCGGVASGESCRRAMPAQPLQDHLLIQAKRSVTSKVSTVKWADAPRCNFATSPGWPYYWEAECRRGVVGCLADGVHEECRFCDKNGIPCPETAWWPIQDICNFTIEPLPADVGYYYDEACVEEGGGLGCKADGQHMACRLCGGGAYAQIPCQEPHCHFESEPKAPYFYDHNCTEGMLGCKADGHHLGCRFCGQPPYDKVTCPRSTTYPLGKVKRCWFRNEPVTGYYWDESCKWGVLGCWADDIHPQCRFCSNETGSDYAAVPCP